MSRLIVPLKIVPLKKSGAASCKGEMQLVILGFLFLNLILNGITAGAAQARPIQSAEANTMVELTFTSTRTYTDPFNQIVLDVTFTDPNGLKTRVPAFWNGGQVWKVRYASPVVGTHHYQGDYADAGDKGLHGIQGTVEIKPYTGQNQLYAHGPLRVDQNHRTLEYSDGTPFFWLGDTWWMGLCHRLHWPEEFKTLAANRVAKGFNVIQIVAGLYPDMPPFDPRGANEAGFPWEKDFSRIRPEYFDAADKRIEHLIESGLRPCIVGAWGYFLPLMGVEKAKQHWRYLIARYGAMPVVWCVAGEANLPYYQAKGFPYDDREQVKGWTEVMRYVRETDPFHRLMTIHPTGIGRLSARHATDDVSLLDFDMLQTPHGQREAVPPTVNTMHESYADKPVMPVINGEAAYEMLGDSLPTEWTRRMFWLCMMNGAAGHTYGANGIWQCNRRGEPHGPSPTAGSPPTGYGIIPWDEAMNLPGSAQEGYGKKLLEQFQWWEFKPHPEWAEFARQPVVSLEDSGWIWFPEGDPAQDAPVGKRSFRRSFELPAGKTIQGARLRVSADDRFTARLNGQLVGSGQSWRTPQQFNDLTSLPKPGTNVLAIEGENMPAPTANPAGLIAALEVDFADGTSVKIVSDATWRTSQKESTGWDTTGFDDTGWSAAKAISHYGEGPWGQFDPIKANDTYGPQSTGIPGGVRIIYVPESQPVTVHSLGNDMTASYFNPVSGARTPIGPVHPDSAHSWQCPPPAGNDQDWVIVLEVKGA